jgi:Lrp/AsnC family transcriptional regulator, regulator for asnA, asnC and gidA
MKKVLDELDRRLVGLLTRDGRMSVGDIASCLGVSAPTVRSRIKGLEKAGLLKISGLIDPAKHQDLTTALIGLNIISQGKLPDVLEKLEKLENITWAAVVTGRYDIMAEVVFKGEMDELYRITSIDIPKVGNVVKSETFVVMKSNSKWVSLPRGIAGDQRENL